MALQEEHSGPLYVVVRSAGCDIAENEAPKVGDFRLSASNSELPVHVAIEEDPELHVSVESSSSQLSSEADFKRALMLGSTGSTELESEYGFEVDTFEPAPGAGADEARFSHVLHRAKEAMQDSGHVANVEFCRDEDSWSVILQPIETAGGEGQAERLLTLTKKVLLEACTNSKCVYIMGYCAPQPFVMRPQGFEAQLGVMESPQTACWHIYKKGFCSRVATCRKQHPAIKIPVRFLVETVRLKSSCKINQNYFKQQVADLTTAVITTLRECNYADHVEAFVDEGQGWSIEVIAKEEELTFQKQYLTDLAKHILLGEMSSSKSLYIMAYTAKPFLTTDKGFVTILGDMQHESRACWELYSKGTCCRGCECLWEHPECLMPIRIVFKGRSSLKSSCRDHPRRLQNGVLAPPHEPYRISA